MRHTRSWLQELSLLLLINLMISCLLFLLSEDDSFTELWVYTNCIGLCCALLAELLQRIAAKRLKVWQAHLLTLAPGLLLGLVLAALLGQPEALTYMLAQPSLSWRNWALCLLMTLIGAGFALSRYQAQVYRAELERERRRLAEYHQADTQAQLRLLQAQIEPHFLFNTLANVHSLIGLQPEQAQKMLTHFNNYLRASLQRTRRPFVTLKQELELIENLLEMAKIRLGDRLVYQLDIKAHLLHCPFPPLLLQPLVENALMHGIEPLLGQGELSISADTDGEQLVLTVSDNGVGLQQACTRAGAGIGLANVRQLSLIHI